MQTVEIRDATQKHFLDFDLREVLQAIEHFSGNYRWSVLWLSGAGENIQELEESVAAVPQGLVTDWNGLLLLSQRISQTYDGLFVATDPDSPEPTLIAGELEHTPAVALIVEAVDSSYWLVSARSPGALTSIRERFRDVMPHPSPSDSEVTGKE